jgi:Holliday junction resolvase RusA-like endonuclease
MANPISFWVDGCPKAQPRPRAFARKFGDKYQARVYDSGSAEGWKGCIALAARAHKPAVPLDVPIRLDVDFYFPRPKCLMRKKDPEGVIRHVQKPDRDNLDKAVADTLTSIGFWRDDCLICEGEIRKFFVAKTGTPGARITVTPLADALAQPIQVQTPADLFADRRVSA